MNEGNKEYTEFLLQKVEERARKKRNKTCHTKKNSHNFDLNTFQTQMTKPEESVRFTSFSTFDNRGAKNYSKNPLTEDYENFIHNISQTISNDGNSCEGKIRRII